MEKKLVFLAQGSQEILASGEVVMTGLLMAWETGWLLDPRTSGWVISSWESALKEEPEASNVDDLPGPPAVIYLKHGTHSPSQFFGSLFFVRSVSLVHLWNWPPWKPWRNL